VPVEDEEHHGIVAFGQAEEAAPGQGAEERRAVPPVAAVEEEEGEEAAGEELVCGPEEGLRAFLQEEVAVLECGAAGEEHFGVEHDASRQIGDPVVTAGRGQRMEGEGVAGTGSHQLGERAAGVAVFGQVRIQIGQAGGEDPSVGLQARCTHEAMGRQQAVEHGVLVGLRGSAHGPSPS
jgi:hypothetical protein